MLLSGALMRTQLEVSIVPLQEARGMGMQMVRGIATAFFATTIGAGALAQVPTMTPRVTLDGPALTFDFPGLRIGVAEYVEGPTGTTVF